MTTRVAFRPYSLFDRDACLRLFDANGPEFFAPNERQDYLRFLSTDPVGYELCLVGSEVVGAFGLIGDDPTRRSLNWILLRPQVQGQGLGAAIMRRVVASARASNLNIVTIAASHKSAPFFVRFGAIEGAYTANGWGPGMHRVDMELKI